MKQMAPNSGIKSSRSAVAMLMATLLVVGGGAIAWLLLPNGAPRLSFVATVKLGLEVTLLCLLIGVPSVYAAFRQPRWPMLARYLVAAAMASLLVPTIARSLSLSALFSYYGPLVTGLRTIGLWPQGQPLDSSHLAVVIALVTLYLPFVLLILSESMQLLGRTPDVAATLGAGNFQTSLRVTLPTLLRPIAIVGLIIFSQVLGVIITPRILGSEDVTLAILIDDLLKRSMDISAALRVAWSEMALAIPLAAVAAYFIEAELTARARPLQAALRFRGGRILALTPVVILSVVPVALVVLSIGRSPILDMASVFQTGPTLNWYGNALSDPDFQSTIIPSLEVWITAAVLSIFPATVISIRVLGHKDLRRLFRWLALVLLFIPQNALGVLLFILVGAVPAIQAQAPSWLLAAAGQAIPGFAFSYLLMDRVSDSLVRSLNIAGTMGATASQRLLRIGLPRLLPSMLTCFAATALISLDDIVFVRYVPRVSVNTFATELFGRARYGAAPDLAAACILMALLVLILVGTGSLVNVVPRIRRNICSIHRESLLLPVETSHIGGTE
jgi:ABC-type spermidine/putrescine transport system permease subunit II